MSISEVQKKIHASAGSGVAINFKRGGGIIFTLFQEYFFRKNKFETIGENKKSSRGVRGYAPPENFGKFTCHNGYFGAF